MRVLASASERDGGKSVAANAPPYATTATLSLRLYASLSRVNAAPFATPARWSAIDPDASTANTVNTPALRDMRLIRKSSFSIHTRCASGDPESMPRRRRRENWCTAAARRVASTAIFFITPPRGNSDLTYLPRS